MRVSPSIAYTRELRTATWTVNDQVLIVAWNFPVATLRPSASLVVNDQTMLMSTRFIDCISSRALEDETPSTSILVSRVRRSPRATWKTGALEIHAENELLGVGTIQVKKSVDEFCALVADGLHGVNGEIRAQVIDALATMSLPGIPSSDTDQVSEQLLLIRKALRQRLPYGRIGRHAPRALVIDALSTVDDRSFYVQGWMHDAEEEITRLVAVSPEGIRTELLPLASQFSRPDVDQVYGTEDDDHPRRPLAFSCFFQPKAPSPRRTGWIFELHNAGGQAIQAKPMLTARASDDVRLRILSDLMYDASDPELAARHVHPALTRLQHLSQASVEVSVLETFGPLVEAPDVSIIIPLYKRIDFLEHQLAQFALDPDIRQTDLVYVLDSPKKANRLRKEAAELFTLYNVSFRVAILRRNSGFAAATNAGAAVARGRLLLLLNSDVLPDRPGWLGKMTRFYDANSNIGALGPKLIYEDEGLQHAGMYFLRFPGSQVWTNMHYFKGLHRSHPQANVVRPVPAVTGACLMVSRDRYSEVGGLGCTYVQGDFEDSDLCLRLISAGYENWYLPEAELYHLEGQSYPTPIRELTYRYNSWLHSFLWNDLIETVMSNFDASRIDGAPSAIVGIERPLPRQPALTRQSVLLNTQSKFNDQAEAW